jgi:antirestriction protein
MSEGLAGDIYDAVEKVDDVVIHENQSMVDIAYSLIEECYSLDKVPDLIANHIDYEGIAIDLMLEGNYYHVDNDVYEYIS